MATGILCFLAAATICWTPIQQRAAQVELHTQINSRYSYFSQGRYDLMWEMSSKRFQESNEHNKEKYVSDLQKYGLGRVKAKILGTRITGHLGQVTVHVSIWSRHDKKWLIEVTREKWIVEDGRWVFDNLLPANKSRQNGQNGAPCAPPGQPVLSSSQLTDRVIQRHTIERPGSLGKNKVSGIVNIEVLINKQGKVICARGVDGHPLAMGSAVRSVRRWTFRPYARGGKAISVAGVLSIPFDFGS